MRHFEVWNEPNLKNFFRYGNSSNIGKYKGLVKAAYTNIKAANPNAIVIAGVGGPRSSGGGGNVSAKVWMNQLVRGQVRQVRRVLAAHLPVAGAEVQLALEYDKAFPTWNSLQLIYDTLDKKRKGMKLYVTEAGYTTATTPFRNVKVSPSQQNTYLKQLYNLPLVKSPRMAAVVWFNLAGQRRTGPAAC